MTLAVLINLHARRGTPAFAEKVRRLFPRAHIITTGSQAELEAYLRDEVKNRPPSLLLAGGGDGTITSLINTLLRQELPIPPLGVLPLGTGNAWARVSGASKPWLALRRLAALGDGSPPLRTFGLVRVEDHVAPFAGTGWDAEIISDFKAQLETWPAGPIRDAHRGLRGYLSAVYTRTAPRHLFSQPPRMRLINLGDEVLGVDAQGRARPLPGLGNGSVLFDGRVGIAGAATMQEFGFGLRAFPFAQLVPERLNVRVYAATAMQGLRNVLNLWRGQHPLKDMHDFFVTRARMEFDRAVPFQIAGDGLGDRTSVEFTLDPKSVQLLDWSRLPPPGK